MLRLFHTDPAYKNLVRGEYYREKVTDKQEVERLDTVGEATASGGSHSQTTAVA